MCPRRREDLSFVQLIGNHLSQLNWETGGFEENVRRRFGWFGNNMTMLLQQNDSLRNWAEQAKAYARQNPIQSLIIGCFLLAVAFPIVCFVAFAAITVLIGLGSFVLIEGTIITIGIMILGSCLLMVGVVAGSFTLSTLTLLYILAWLKKSTTEFIYPKVEVEVVKEEAADLVHSD